ncbi:MAG: MFS transporter, partial [Cyanobacteria bacterium J06638_22]
WLLISTISLALSSFPAFWILHQDNSSWIWLTQLGLALLIGPLLAISPAMMVEIFPTETRLTAYSLSFNLGVSILGGTSLFICTWLIDMSGNVYAPAMYLMANSLMCAIAIGFMNDRSREPLM